MKLSGEEREVCINLSRETIEKSIIMYDEGMRNIYQLKEELSKEIDFDYLDNLKNKGACFITIYKKGLLRGCIGHLEAFQPLHEDIIENSISAGLEDPRFDPLKPDELNDIKVEISVLSKPKKLKFKDIDILLSKLDPKRHGVILKKGIYSATFLPQVWNQIPDKISFLSNLCIKAGLSPDEWKESSDIYTYEVDSFSE